MNKIKLLLLFLLLGLNFTGFGQACGIYKIKYKVKVINVSKEIVNI